jgi:transglutaminase-like putative cysteine protease
MQTTRGRGGVAGALALGIAFAATAAWASGAADGGFGLYKDGRRVAGVEDLLAPADAARLGAIVRDTPGLRLFRRTVGTRPTGETDPRHEYLELVLRAQRLTRHLIRSGVDPFGDVALSELAALAPQHDARHRAALDLFEEIERSIRAGRLPAEKLGRHLDLVAGFRDAGGRLSAALNDVAGAYGARGDFAMAAALRELDAFFAEHVVEPAPPLLNALPPVMMERKRAAAIEPADRVASIPYPTGGPRFDPADLDSTIDVQFTPDIVALADSLGNDPVALYYHVRDDFAFEPYLGSRKGSQQTLEHRRGNDYDLASLLIALLRVSGVPARYAEGTVRMPIDRALNWLGFEDKANAGSILATAGMEGTLIIAGPDTVAIDSKRVWVEAWLPFLNYRGAANDGSGFRWVPLDPAFKQHAYDEGINFPAEIGFDGESYVEDYISTFHAEPPVEKMRNDLLAQLPSYHPGATLEDLFTSRTVVREGDGILAGALPYELLSLDGTFSEIAADKRYRVRFHLYDGAGLDLDYTTTTPEVAGKQVTISYEGATAGDQQIIDDAGGVYNVTTPWLVDVVPVLKIDGCEVARGAGGSVTMGFSHNSDMHFTPPAGASNQIPAVFNAIIAGNFQGIGIDTEDAFPEIFDVPATSCEEIVLARELHQTALTYLNNVDLAGDELAGLLHQVVLNDVSEAIVESSVRVLFSGGLPITFDWTGMIVDADRKIVGPFAVDGRDNDCDYMRVGGADGSVQENRLFETRYGEEAISAIKILELAADSAITVCHITTSIAADCPGLDQPPDVVAAINAALAAGHHVIIPERGFTYFDWTGTGYIDLDPATCAAGYIISGGRNGGATVQDWSAELAAMLAGGTVCIEPVGPITVTPDPDVAGDLYCGANEGRWEFTVPTITGWGVDADDNCVVKTTLTNKTFTVTNYTIKQLAEHPTFGPGKYVFRVGSPSDPYGCGCTIIEKEVTIFAAVIKSLTPSGEVSVGDSVEVAYSVEPSDFSFDTVELHVKNKDDALVYKATGLDGSAGMHTGRWEDARWNQGSAPFPYANPANSDYKIILVGKKGGFECESKPEKIKTKLVIEADIKDPEVTAGAERAGIKDLVDALKIVLKKGSAETVFSGSGAISATFKNDFEVHVKVQDPGLNSLANGDYEVLFRDLRDQIGNFSDADAGTNGIQEIKFDLRLN